MAIQLQININTNLSGSPKVTFDPNPLAASKLDQIFWTNNDGEAHWPGLQNTDGTINKTFFMPNQIAPNGGSSPIFASPVKADYPYACSLHSGEEGLIQVT